MEDKQAEIDIVQKIITAGRRNREQAPVSQSKSFRAVSVDGSAILVVIQWIRLPTTWR